MPYTVPLHRALKMMSRKKALLLLLLALSTLSLLIHQSAHLSWSPKPSSPGCPPGSSSRPKHTSVAFLKTHKTAGTTVQNILFRFAEQHNVTVALPHHACDHQFCYPRNFSARFVHPHTLPPRIIANHLRFQRHELRRLMPNDTLYVTILREPVAMFESLFTYYNQYCPSFRRVPNGSMEAFLANPLAFYRPQEKFSMYAHNILLYDLGGDNDHSPADSAYLPSFIRQMEEVFSLVMIAEHFDESLVLLRRLLAWDLEDVLYVKLNMRGPRSKGNGSSEVLAARIRAWNALDAQLYDHFNATFWRKMAQAGRECVAEEVRALRRACDQLVRRCFGGLPQLRPATQIKNKELRPWQPSSKVDIVGYDLPLAVPGSGAPPDERCLKLAMPEDWVSTWMLDLPLRSRPGRHLPDSPEQMDHLRHQTPWPHPVSPQSPEPAAFLVSTGAGGAGPTEATRPPGGPHREPWLHPRPIAKDGGYRLLSPMRHRESAQLLPPHRLSFPNTAEWKGARPQPMQTRACAGAGSHTEAAASSGLRHRHRTANGASRRLLWRGAWEQDSTETAYEESWDRYLPGIPPRSPALELNPRGWCIIHHPPRHAATSGVGCWSCLYGDPSLCAEMQPPLGWAIGAVQSSLILCSDPLSLSHP